MDKNLTKELTPNPDDKNQTANCNGNTEKKPVNKVGMFHEDQNWECTSANPGYNQLQHFIKSFSA